MWIIMSVPILYLNSYIWSPCCMPLCNVSLTDTWESCICKRASMGISFEAITCDSNLQWDLEWQLCICLETNAKQNAATQLQLPHFPLSVGINTEISRRKQWSRKTSWKAWAVAQCPVGKVWSNKHRTVTQPLPTTHFRQRDCDAPWDVPSHTKIKILWSSRNYKMSDITLLDEFDMRTQHAFTT